MRKRPKTGKIKPSTKKEAKSAPVKPGRITWSFAIFDNGIQWGNHDRANAPFRYVANRMRQYESRRWTEIERDRKRDHYVPKNKLIKRARDRLVAIKQDDIDLLWRFRFTGTERLWGVRVGDEFRVL